MTWIILRTIVDTFEVEAASMEEAISLATEEGCETADVVRAEYDAYLADQEEGS